VPDDSEKSNHHKTANMSDSNFLNKILLLLDKTKDALIEDLKKEFVSVRTALDENASKDNVFSLSNEFSKKVNIIDAVFAKVGYDISHYEQLGNLKQQVLSMLSTVDGLTDDVKKLADDYNKDNKLDGDEVAGFLDTAVPHIQALLSVVKNITDIEWERVADEIYGAGSDMGENFKEQFINKEFGRKILDHIVITLLKNAKDVFHDEIEFIRMTVVNGAQQVKENAEALANSIVSQITDGANQAQSEITAQVNALLRETLDEYTSIRQRLEGELNNMKDYINAAGDDIVNSNIYVKITRAFSITYSILDFLGVVREVRVTLRLPSQLQKLIRDAENLVSKADGELGKAIDKLSTKIDSFTDEATSGVESLQGDVVDALQDASTTVANATAHVIDQMDEELQVTKEVTGLSTAAMGAMQTQLLTLYGPDGKSGQLAEISGGINGILNKLSDQAEGVLVNVNSQVNNICKDINKNLETVKNISYPVTIVTVSWKSVESLFTQPVSHFKSLYPINNVDDIENLMRRIMGIMHCINPDIPDFDSLRNMLESLLKQLQQKVIMLVNEAKQKAKETAKEIWNKFQPIIATIRKVIDMLKELALALKDKMYGVLNDLKAEMGEVMSDAKQLIAELQEQLKQQAGIILDSTGNLVTEGGTLISNAGNTLEGKLNKVFEQIDNVNKKIVNEAAKELGEAASAIESGSSGMQGAINEAQEGVESLTDTVVNWVDEQRKALAKINIPRIVNRTIAEPLINCASGILQDTLGLDKAPDFTSVFDLMRDIVSLKSLLARQVVLQPAAISNDIELPQISFTFSEMTGQAQSVINNALNSIKDVVNSVNVLNTPNIDVENIVLPQLQAWAYSVMASMKTVVDPKVWKKRMDNLITQLQAEFQNDLQNVTGLISKEGANRLIADAGAVKDQLKNNLQINDYVTIVQTAMNDVVLPNPELYFSSLKTTLANIVAQLSAALIDSYNSFKGQLTDKAQAIENIVNKLVEELEKIKDDAVRQAIRQKKEWENWADNIKDKAVEEALKRFNSVKDAILNIVKRIKELLENVKAFIDEKQDKLTKENLNKHLEELKESLKSRLEDLALEIWNNIKAEVITPILTTIKDEIIRRIRALVKQAMQQLINALTQVEETTGELAKALNKVPGIKELKEAIQQLASNVEREIKNNAQLKNALSDIKGFDPNDPKITDLNQLPAIFEKLKDEKVPQNLWSSFKLQFTPHVDAVVAELTASKEYQVMKAAERAQWLANEIEKRNLVKVEIPAEYICWAQSLLQAAINFAQSDMKAKDIINLVVAVYKGIPESVKEYIATLMPEMPQLPDNSLTRTLKQATCNYDLDNKFCNITMLDLKGTDKTGNTSTDASLLVQIFAFVGTYGTNDENEEIAVTIKDGDNANDDTAVEENAGKPALYFMFYLRGKLKFAVYTENHEFNLNLEAAAGQQFDGNQGENTGEPTEQSLGFCLTKKTDDDPNYFHGWASTKSLSGLFEVAFQRKKDNPATLLNTKYLDINIDNYPQVAYVLFNHEYPELVKESLNWKEKADGFTAGYMAKLENMEIVLKLRQNEFFKSILKDDISAKFTLSLIYDYLKGFDFGGGYSFHIDLDCSNLKLGKLHMQGLGIDIGSLKNDWGTLQLGVGSSFSINLDAVAFSFENLGISLSLNILKPDFSLGDWDFGCKFKFPTGIGIAIDAPAVKGSGLISYEESTGELLGALELKVVNKFGVSAFMLVDLGTVKGHYFSFVGLISTTFTPGIPLGMGFSLTGIGGCLGLERMIDRTAITTAVRQGTMASIFFVEDLQNHLAEMKATAVSIFPAKKDQFFVGLLGQISYEPVLSCSFGLMLQLPHPTEFIIVGSLKVSIKDTDVIRINVQFAGGINFEEGIWFDASLIDSEIVGIKLEGDMAFRLFWGGATKGFLLSIGGFHPNYTPEPGMLVNDMKRLAMKMDYGILKLGLETYLAITSNSFQIGAHLDLKIGWDKFGIFGYAGFDALFQFDPFMFMFDVECGVAVKCGGWTLLSIDLAFSLSGPRPWHVSGKAKFYFIFIPIKVSFSLEWGNKQPELPNKQIELKPLFDEQIMNNNNWTISETVQSDDDVVVSMKHKEGELLVQPFETVHFNQSAIPLQLERAMDLCNNAVPTDYRNLTIKGFTLSGDKLSKEADDDNLSNDFAPGLYYNLTNKEKLSTPSYKKYVSGFSLSATEGVDKGFIFNETIEKGFCMKKKGSEKPQDITVNQTTEGTLQPTSNAAPTPVTPTTETPTPEVRPVRTRRSRVKKSTDQLLEAKEEIGLIIGALQYKGPVELASAVKGVKEDKIRRISYTLKTRKAFDRYIKILDSINENI
jgi:hypothetical protein